MKERLELRLDPAWAARHLPEVVSSRTGSVAKILVDPLGPVMDRLRAMEGPEGFPNELRSYWCVHRSYSRGELESSALLQIEVTARTEKTAEGYGTTFEGRSVCPTCKYGRRQTSDLHFAESKLRTGKDVLEALSNEVLVSERFASALRSIDATGCRFAPVRRSRPRGAIVEGWYQLLVESAPIELGPRTVTGIGPFEPDIEREFACSDHDWIALNQISIATVVRESWDGSDVCATRQRIGSVLGALSPRPLLMFSNRAWRALMQERMRGFRFDRVDLESGAEDEASPWKRAKPR